MNEILVIILIFEIMIIYFFNGRNVLSPSFIEGCLFLFSTIIFCVAKDYFLYQLSIKTVLTIFIMIFATFMGEMLAKRIKVKKQLNSEKNKILKSIEIDKKSIIIFFVFVLVTGILYYRAAYNFSLTVGNKPGDYFSVAKYTRFIGGFNVSTFLSQSSVLSECIIYFIVFIYFYNKNIFNNKNNFILLPLIGFIPHILANDGRTVLIKYLCVICIIFFIIYKEKNNWKVKSNSKLMKIALLAITLFLILFRVLGYRTGASINNELGENLVQYISSGLVGLDIFLNSDNVENELFGQETFKAIYATLRGFGFDIINYNSNDVFFNYAQGASNVYTGLKCYIKDFSFIGALIVMFLIGFIIEYLIKVIKNKGITMIRVYIAGLMFYPVVMMSVAASSHVVLCLPTLYSYIYLKVLELIFIKKKIRWGNNGSNE